MKLGDHLFLAQCKGEKLLKDININRDLWEGYYLIIIIRIKSVKYLSFYIRVEFKLGSIILTYLKHIIETTEVWRANLMVIWAWTQNWHIYCFSGLGADFSLLRI